MNYPPQQGLAAVVEGLALRELASSSVASRALQSGSTLLSKELKNLREGKEVEAWWDVLLCEVLLREAFPDRAGP
jgi:hypothetical protein